jgi:tetratricopeptide (TPR) repeat protein
MFIRYGTLAILVLSVQGLRLPAQDSALSSQSRIARQALLDGRYQEAVSLYRKLVDALPSDNRLRLNLALALEKAGNNSAAIAELKKVTQAEPKLAPAWFLLGLAHQRLKQPGQAIRPLQQAVQLDPGNLPALLELADAELNTGRARDAIRDFGALSRREPEMTKAWQGLGMSYVAMSEQFFKQIEREYPRSTAWYALAARSSEGAGRDAEALRFYQQAIQAGPVLRGLHAARAEIYKRTGHADWAAEEEKRESQIPPLECSRPSAACAYEKKDWQAVVAAPSRSAEDLYWSALASAELARESLSHLERLPPSPEMHEVLAEADQRMGRRIEAVAEWRKALAMDPTSNRIQGRLAESLYRAREYAEAETMLKKLVKTQPENGNWQYLLGSVLFNEHRDAEALPYLRRSVQLLADFLPAQALLGRVYLNLDQPAKAVQFLERARALNDPPVLFALSTAYRRSGEAAKAKAVLEQYRSLSGMADRSARPESGDGIPAP